MTIIRDANGKKIAKNIRREANGTYSCQVWFGGGNGLATTVRTYRYATRAQARAGDISDDIGSRGRVA